MKDWKAAADKVAGTHFQGCFFPRSLDLTFLILVK
jgi:hypothetical protein